MRSVIGFLLLLFREYGADALRNTLIAIVPATFLFYSGHLDLAIALGTGALLSSLTDSAGNRVDKWRSVFWCIPLFFCAAYMTAFVLDYPILLIIWLVVAAFASSMLAVYGPRVGAVGLMTLILVTFTIGVWPIDVIVYSLMVTLGVCLYYAVSILQVYFDPYRAFRYALADSFHSMAILLRAKSHCYDNTIALESVYRELGALHVRVSEKHETVRHLLLHDSKLLEASISKEQNSLDLTLGLTDLYELLTALDHDYDAIRRVLTPYHVLDDIQSVILLLSYTVEQLARSCRYKTPTVHSDQHAEQIEVIMSRLIEIKDTSAGEGAQVLGATVRNVTSIMNCIAKIRRVQSNAFAPVDRGVDRSSYTRFVSPSPKGLGVMKGQFNFNTAVFSFSLRLAVLFGVGGLLGFLLPEYRYTYWILLTLALVAKPSLANTKRRNAQRIVGTIGGVIVGLLLIYLVPSSGVMLFIAVGGLFGFFLFNKTDYMVSVLLLTPGIIIALHVYEGGMLDILGSRIIFTFIGCFLALIGWFFIPVRQGKTIVGLAKDVVAKNAQYFELVRMKISGEAVAISDLRLLRKQAHTTMATFSDAILQFQQEPGYKKWDENSINRFHSLAYRTNALIIGLSVSASTIEDVGPGMKSFSEQVDYIAQLTSELSSSLPRLQ